MKNQDQSFNLEAKSTSMKSRDKKKVAATFHQAGKYIFIIISKKNSHFSQLASTQAVVGITLMMMSTLAVLKTIKYISFKNLRSSSTYKALKIL